MFANLRQAIVCIFLVLIGSAIQAQTFYKSIFDPLKFSIFWGDVKQTNDSTITFLAKAQRGLTIAKLDALGGVRSSIRLAFETCRFYDHDFKAAITPDSSIVIASSVYYDAYITRAFIAKLDKNAQPVWLKSISGVGSNDVASGIKYTSDGGYIIAGERWIGSLNPAAAYLVKLDSSGDVEWAKIFNRNRMDEFYDVEEIHGSYYAVGKADSIGVDGSYASIVKTNISGNAIWAKGLGSPLEVTRAIVNGNNTLIIAGNTSNNQPFVSKLDTNGNLLWTKYYQFDQDAYAWRITMTSDTGFIVSGSYGRQHSSDSLGWFAMKTDSNGDILWCRVYGGKASWYGSGGVQELSDKTLLSFAKYETNNAIFLVYKTDSAGNCPGICELSTSPTVSSISVLDSAIVFDEFFVSVDDSAIVYQVVSDSLTGIDTCGMYWLTVNEENVTGCRIFPNPVSGLLNIELPSKKCDVLISDLLGKTVYRQKSVGGHLQVDMTMFQQGIYTCIVTSAEKVWRSKVEVH
jgi:hypothetical protein